MVGKTVLDVDFRSKFGMNIIVIENRGTVMEMIHPDYVFRKDDILLLSGSKEGMQRLNEWIENMTERRKSMR